MPIPLTDALDESADLAAAKAEALRSPGRYLWSSALAGAYVGIAVVLLVSVGGPLVAAGSPFAKLVQGVVFGVALTLVVFAGAELFTGNAMVMLQGALAGRVSVSQVASIWMASLVGNLGGSMVFAALVHAGGTLTTGATAGKPGPADALVASLARAKVSATGPQLFWRAVLCNMLVCLALWMAARTRSDTAKLGVLWWALLAFIASGFEHSVANMTLLSLAAFSHAATWPDLCRNLLWTVPGNVVGGGLIVGAGYSWLAGRPATAEEVPPAPAMDAVVVLGEAVAAGGC
jgi:nitrite transporter NirC